MVASDLEDRACPPEVRQLGRTIIKWRPQIAAWHQAHVQQSPPYVVTSPAHVHKARAVRVG